MDLSNLKSKAGSFIKKYKYAAVVLLLGLGLMLIPGRGEVKTPEDPLPQTPEECSTVSDRLADILSKIDGAGNVCVMLTVETGEQTLYQTDNNVTSSDTSSTTQISTVVVTDSDRGEKGMVRQVNPPVYLGAIVVCEGADSPTVRLMIVDAVSKVTGLGANQISVMKMK